MSIQTTNFGLTKDAATDYYSIDTVNANLDKVDKALGNTAKFEKAGGTATAISLTGIELITGMSKTFIVAADNNGAATKINGKSLFKPGTTTAPKLITGKAVTVWYDAAGDSGNGCFFIKASAEGTAKAEHVLAGETFSNDEDTGLVGTYTPLNDVDTKTGRIIQTTKANDSVAFLTIEGESYQKTSVQGKNILPRTNNPANTTYGITFTPNADGSITINGTNTFAAGVSFQIFGDLSEGPTIFIMKAGVAYTGKKTGSADVTLTINAKWNPIVITDANDQTVTPSTDRQIIGAYLMVAAGATINNLTVYPQLEVGSISTTYEAFTPDSPSPSYPSPITNAKNFDLIAHGKNLFDVNMPNTKSPDITSVVVSGKEIKVISNNTLAYSNIKFILDPTKFKGKTITWSVESFNSTVAGHNAIIQYLYVSGGQTYYRAFTGGKDTANIPADITRLDLYIQINNLSTAPNVPSTVTITGIQIELGDKQTAYEAYKGLYKITIPQELAKLPNGVKDTIEPTADGRIKYVQMVGKVVFDGSTDENWQYDSAYKRYYIPLPGSKESNSAFNNSICSHFKLLQSGGTATSITGYTIPAGSIYLYKNGETLAEFKTWLATNPVTFQYELTTPIESTEDIEFIRTFDGTTTIVTTANPQPNMTAVFKSALANYKRMDANTNGGAGDILADKVVISGGKNVKGTVKDKSGTITNASGTATGPATGYIDVTVPEKALYDTNSKLRIYDVNFVHDNFLATKNVFGAQGAIPVKSGTETNVSPELYYISENNYKLLIKPPKGYYDGASNSLVNISDPNYNPKNIKKGVPIFGMLGTLESERYNFPCAIQDAQPTPLGVGHIWIKSSTLAAKIHQIKFSEYLTAEADGKVIFVLGDMADRTFQTSVNFKLADGSTKELSIYKYRTAGDFYTYWADGANYERFNRPFIYSKVDGVLDVETAYMWDGSKWAQLSQKGSYALLVASDSGSNYPLSIYNKSGDTLSFNTSFQSQIGYPYELSASNDGTLIAHGGRIYKRSGDVFSLHYTPAAEGQYTNIYGLLLSGDGNTLIVCRGFYGTNYSYQIKEYQYNGSTFVEKAIIATYGSAALMQIDYLRLNNAGTVLYVKNLGSNPVVYFKSGSSWVSKDFTYSNVTNAIKSFGFSQDGKYFVAEDYHSTNTYKVVRYEVDTVSMTFKNRIDLHVLDYQKSSNFLGFHPSGLVFYASENVVYCRRLSDGAALGVSWASYTGAMAFNATGDRALVVQAGTTYYCSVSVGSSVSFSPISSYGSAGSGFGLVLIPK